MELQADSSKSQSVDTAGKIWKFRWIVKNFSSTTDEKLYSEDFTAEGNKWRILICPKGNKGDHLSICLGVGVADSATLPSGWRRYAQFGVALIDQNDRKTSITKVATCVFNAKEVDWGFTSFLSLTELHNPLKGYLVNDACLVEAYVSTDTTTGLISHELIVSHELVVETGSAIGNQKTTITRPVEITAPSPSRPSCQIVDIEPEEPTKEDMNTFFTSLESELLSSNTVFSEEEAKEALAKLEAALNMTPINFHDSGEFSPLKLEFKILASVGCSSINLTIEQKTKLLAMEESLKQLADRAAKAVEDKNRLTAKESMKKTVACNLECSLTRYKEVESKVKQVEKELTALQEQVDEAQKERESMLAEQKGIFRSSKNMKMELEALTKECEAKAKVAEDEEKIVEVEWGRMKHFISSVKEDIKRELEEQYGGEEEIRLKKQKEENEQKRKEKAEAHLYTVIKVARNEDLVEQIGKYIYFDLVDHEKVRSFRIQKQMPFKVFKEEVAKEFGIPVQYQRFWLWAKRQNHTYRPHLPLTQQEEAQSVGQLREVSSISNAELKLFLEVELGRNLRPVDPPEKTTQDILLFFKLYDPYKEELRYIGRMFVKGAGKPMEILARINKMAGFDPDEEIGLYEEIKFEPNVMCEHIDKKLTFRTSQLEDGDIICLQKFPEVVSEQCRYPDIPSFLEYVHNRQVVRFRSLEKPKEDEFSLELSKLHNYDDVVEKVAHHLGLGDPSKIRLTSHNCYSQQPKPQPIKYRGVEHLSDMLIHYNQTSDILYYEVLDIPLPELQGLKTLKVAFHHATKDEVVIHTIRLPKQSTVGDVLDDLKTKVELSHPGAELRLLEVFYHKIYKIFPLNEKIENINDQYWTLRAEEIPEEEKNLGPHDRLIHVYHFLKDATQNQVQNFGEPFFLVIREGETLAEVKVRIQKRLQVPDEEFFKWKFAFLSLGHPDYLQDSDVVSTRFQRRDVYGAWEQYLGLEHSDNAPKRSYAANQNRHVYEKPVKIYN